MQIKTLHKANELNEKISELEKMSDFSNELLILHYPNLSEYSPSLCETDHPILFESIRDLIKIYESNLRKEFKKL